MAGATRAELRRMPFLPELLDMGAVNYRGLARHLRPGVEDRLPERDSIRIESIVMAIKRYEDDLGPGGDSLQQIQDVLAESEVSMRSDMVYYTFPRREAVHRAVLDAYADITDEPGTRCYILQSNKEIGFVLPRRHAGTVGQQLEEHRSRRKEAGLALVALDAPEAILDADGILAYLTRQLAMDDIHLVDMLTTYTETVFLVEDRDGDRTYRCLRRLIEDMRDRA